MHYLNTSESNIRYQKARNSRSFVDKSLMIQHLSQRIRTNDQCICITRPPQFGKTTNTDMLGAYYTKGLDSSRLFADLKIAAEPSKERMYTKHLNQHNVIRINFSEMPDNCQTYDAYIESIKQDLADDLKQAYGVSRDPGMSMRDLFNATGDSFIFLFDEWDAVFHEAFMEKEDKIRHLQFLQNLLKDQVYTDLVYMTGVIPIPKYSSGSSLNMFHEYNFIDDPRYDIFFGFTEQEVRKLCEQHPTIRYEELEAWYGGYRTHDGSSLFHPRSVSRALTRGSCSNYGRDTGLIKELTEYMEHHMHVIREDFIQLAAGNSVEAAVNSYSAAEQRMETREDVLAAMAVYGFLSYYDGELQIPNRELMEQCEHILFRGNL